MMGRKGRIVAAIHAISAGASIVLAVACYQLRTQIRAYRAESNARHDSSKADRRTLREMEEETLRVRAANLPRLDEHDAAIRELRARLDRIEAAGKAGRPVE